MHIYYFNPDKVNIENTRVADKEIENLKRQSAKSGDLNAQAGILGLGKAGGKFRKKSKKDTKIEKTYTQGTLGERARKIHEQIKQNKDYITLRKGSNLSSIQGGQLIYFKNSCKAKLIKASFYEKYAELLSKDMIDWESKFGNYEIVFSTSRSYIIGKSTTRRALENSLTFEVFGVCMDIGSKRLTISPIIIINSLKENNG